MVYKWIDICVMLEIPYGKLMEFEKDQNPLIASINFWLRGNVEDVSVSWRSIVKALKSESVKETGLAEIISKKYCNQEESGKRL